MKAPTPRLQPQLTNYLHNTIVKPPWQELKYTKIPNLLINYMELWKDPQQEMYPRSCSQRGLTTVHTLAAVQIAIYQQHIQNSNWEAIPHKIKFKSYLNYTAIIGIMPWLTVQKLHNYLLPTTQISSSNMYITPCTWDAKY